MKTKQNLRLALNFRVPSSEFRVPSYQKSVYNVQRLITITFLLVFLPMLSFGQGIEVYKHANCATEYEATGKDIESLPYSRMTPPICTGPEDCKYVNVNFHFMMNSKIYPNNFTKNNDGQGNSNYTGYDRAKDHVHWMNYRMSQNAQAALPCTEPGVPGSNGTAVLPTRIQYVLRGVYFHETEEYDGDAVGNWRIHHNLGVNPDTEINIYMINNPAIYNGGEATCGSNQGLCDQRNGLAARIWVDYIQYTSGSTPIWETAKLMNHEMGHLMNLEHSYFPNDLCADTEPHSNCWGYNANNPNCDEVCELSNNLMSDNNGRIALTPCQISRIHTRMNNYGNSFVHSCNNNCDPVNSFFYLPENVCLRRSTTQIYLDGRGSWKELSYDIEIMEVTQFGGHTMVPNSVYFQTAQPINGEVGKIDIRPLYNFQYGRTYRVGLKTYNDCGNGISIAYGWVTIENTNECIAIVEPPGSVDRVASNPSVFEGQAYLEREELKTYDEVHTLSEGECLNIFPNPAINKITIVFQVEMNENYRIALHNTTGQEISLLEEYRSNTKELLTRTFSIDDIPNGMYVLNIQTSKGNMTKKLIINK